MVVTCTKIYNINRCHEWLCHICEIKDIFFKFKRPSSYSKCNNSATDYMRILPIILLINATFKLFEWLIFIFIFISWIGVHLTYFDLVMFDYRFLFWMVYVCSFVHLFVFAQWWSQWLSQIVFKTLICDLDALPSNESVAVELNLWTRPDCAGTEYENLNRSWFFFSIQGEYVVHNFQLYQDNIECNLKNNVHFRRWHEQSVQIKHC